MNQDVSGNKQLFCIEVVKVKGEKVENWNKMKDRTMNLAVEEDDV